MTTQPNINGVTVKDMTRIMHSYERIISFFNKKYNFGQVAMPAKDQKSYEDALRGWDRVKAMRDQLIFAA